MSQSTDQEKMRFDGALAEKLVHTGGRRPRRRSQRSKLWRKTRHTFKKYVKLRIVSIAFLVTVVVTVGSQVVLMTDARNQLENSQQNFERVLQSFANKEGTELTLMDFERLESSVSDLSRAVSLTQRRAALIRPLANMTPDWAVYFNTLDGVDHMVNASRDMLRGVQPALFFMVQGEAGETVVTQISSGERLVELLTVGRGQFLRAQNELQQAELILEAVDLSNASADTLLFVEQIEAYSKQLISTNEVLLQMPDVLTAAFGLETDANYLVLAQNNDELRPSGGFIGTWGWMTVRNGRIVDFNYSASTRESPTPPNVNIETEYTIPEWWLQFEQPIFAAWDGSWHADFPATAEMSAWYYNNGEDNPATPVEGVIAIDITGFEYVLAALERVTVSEYGVVVTPENFRDVVYQVRTEGDHKDFVSEVYRAIFTDWQSLDRSPEQSTAIFGAMLQAVNERHVMIYFENDNLQQAVERLGWTGSQDPATDHDYLMVADANVSPNKSNNSIVRQWTYDVTIQEDGSLSSRTSVTYDYPNSIASGDPAVNPEFHGPIDYRNLLQIIVPPGSEPTTDDLEDDVRVIDIVQGEDYTRFVSVFTLEYDTAERIQYSYETPPLTEQFGDYRRYRLLLQKQPGAREEAVTVTITLPEGAELVSSSPQFATSYVLDNLILDYRINLETDQWIEIIYR